MTAETPRKGQVWCPDCYKGIAYQACSTCEGSGTDAEGLRVAACGDCEGSGEVGVPCTTCNGDEFISLAEMRFREVRRRHERPPPPFAFHYVDQDADLVAQRHHGITDYALLAYLDFRLRLRRAAARDTLQINGVKTLVRQENLLLETAGVLFTFTEGEKQPPFRLFLSGLSWGYGGEGPRGFATILQDLGRFPSEEAAMSVIAKIPMAKFHWAL